MGTEMVAAARIPLPHRPPPGDADASLCGHEGRGYFRFA